MWSAALCGVFGWPAVRSIEAVADRLNITPDVICVHYYYVCLQAPEGIPMVTSNPELRCAGLGEAPTKLTELVDEYAAYGCRVSSLADATVNELRLYVNRFLEAQPASSPTELFSSLSPTGIQRFVFEYPGSYGPDSRRWMQRALRSFLRFCHSRGYISHDLSIAVPAYCSRRLSSVPRGIDDETVRLLLENTDDGSSTGLRDRAIIQLLATYGVRGIQARQLCLDDVKWRTDLVQFRAVKGGRTVVQHLTPEVGNSLLAYIQEARPNTAPYSEVFLTSRSPFRPFRSSSGFSAIISRRLRKIGVELPKGVSRGTHSFRHAFASRMVGKVPLKHIADMLGHRDLSSSYIYTKVDFEALSQAALRWPVEVV
jgi:site-specific recombinase XerD